LTHSDETDMNKYNVYVMVFVFCADLSSATLVVNRADLESTNRFKRTHGNKTLTVTKPEACETCVALVEGFSFAVKNDTKVNYKGVQRVPILIKEKESIRMLKGVCNSPYFQHYHKNLRVACRYLLKLSKPFNYTRTHTNSDLSNTTIQMCMNDNQLCDLERFVATAPTPCGACQTVARDVLFELVRHHEISMALVKESLRRVCDLISMRHHIRSNYLETHCTEIVDTDEDYMDNNAGSSFIGKKFLQFAADNKLEVIAEKVPSQRSKKQARSSKKAYLQMENNVQSRRYNVSGLLLPPMRFDPKTNKHVRQKEDNTKTWKLIEQELMWAVCGRKALGHCASTVDAQLDGPYMAKYMELYAKKLEEQETSSAPDDHHVSGDESSATLENHDADLPMATGNVVGASRAPASQKSKEDQASRAQQLLADIEQLEEIVKHQNDDTGRKSQRSESHGNLDAGKRVYPPADNAADVDEKIEL